MALCPAAAQAEARAQKYYYEDISQPFFALDPAAPGLYRNQRPGSKPSLFPAVKPKDGLRVFVLGGSIAGLLQQTGEKYELAQALAAVLPSKTVEVINCGMAGYESFREALIEQEILEYSPDLIVFLTGHNESLASAPIPIWIMRTQERLSRFDAYRALVKRLQPNPWLGGVHTDARADARDATFARNLADNIRHARARGVAVAVVVPPRNYREPVELGRMLYDAEFVPGWLRFLQGDYAAARKAWTQTLARTTRGREATSEEKAFTEGFIGRSEEKLGLLDEARASFERAALADRAAICGTICQGILRRVTMREGGFLIEADRMFRKLAFPRMPGLETFNDRMHWKPRYNCLMSMTIIGALRGEPGLGALPWDLARLKELEGSCEKPGQPPIEADDRRILGYVLLNLSGANLDRLSTVSVFYLQALRRGRPDWFNDIPKLTRRATNPQTDVYGVAGAPEAVVLPRFHWHIGEVRMLEKDYGGAIKEYAKALKLDPALMWARLGLGVAEALRGDKKRALERLKDACARSAREPRGADLLAAAAAAAATLDLGGAEELFAFDAAHWVDKAQAALSAGRNADADTALEKARGLSPPPHELRRIGQYYMSLKEPAKFLAVSDALAAVYPQDADLWRMRAEAALVTGDAVKSLAALSRAESLQPDAVQLKYIRHLRGRLKKGEKDKIERVGK